MLTESITLKTQDNESDKPIYLCDWNDGEIVQIHSKETLEKEYKEALEADGSDEQLIKTSIENIARNVMKPDKE